MFDWDGDGRRDLQDDAFYLSEIDKKNIDDESKNLEKKSSSVSHNKKNKPQEINNKPKFEITGLGKVVLIAGAILCGAALLTGYAKIIGTLLSIGFIVFCIAQWLDS